MRDGFFIDPLADQRIIHIRQRDRLCGDGNFVALQPIRIAPSVVALVVPAADIVRRAHQRLVAVNAEAVENFRAEDRMGLHDLKLCGRKLAGLVENFFIDGDLADVVQRRRRCDPVAVRDGELIFVRFLHQTRQNVFRQLLHMQDVHSAFSVAEFHRLAQDIDHHMIVFLFFIDLIGDDRDQPALLGVELDGVEHAPVNDLCVKGAVDVVDDTEIERLPDDVLGIRAGDHDDRNILDHILLRHRLEHREAVHGRHDDVQQDRADIGLVLPQHLHADRTVFRLDDLVITAQDLCEQRAVEL